MQPRGGVPLGTNPAQLTGRRSLLDEDGETLALAAYRISRIFAIGTTETTSGYQVTWIKGQSGNPAGRPKGSKHKLQTSFWNDLHRTWKENGAEALRWVAENDPSTFVRVCASLMPREETAKKLDHAIEITLKEPAWLRRERTNSEPLTIEQQASSEEKDPQGRG